MGIRMAMKRWGTEQARKLLSKLKSRLFVKTRSATHLMSSAKTWNWKLKLLNATRHQRLKKRSRYLGILSSPVTFDRTAHSTFLKRSPTRISILSKRGAHEKSMMRWHPASCCLVAELLLYSFVVCWKEKKWKINCRGWNLIGWLVRYFGILIFERGACMFKRVHEKRCT